MRSIYILPPGFFVCALIGWSPTLTLRSTKGIHVSCLERGGPMKPAPKVSMYAEYTPPTGYLRFNLRSETSTPEVSETRITSN